VRIVLVGAVPRRLHAGPVAWGGHEFHVTSEKFSRFADFTTPARDELVLDRERLAAFVAACDGSRLVLCESPEALVLAAEWARRGERPRPIVAFDVHQLRRVRALSRWYREHEGHDPWPATAAAPWIAWVVNSAHQHAPLVAAGVPPARIHRVFGCSAAFSMLLPDADARLDGGPDADGAAADGLPAGAVALPGSGRRDHVTGLRAAAALPAIDFVAVAENAERRRPRLGELGLADLPNVRWLDPVPLEAFVALLRRSRLVVVPLEPGAGDGGHLTVGLAHRLGVPVVASAVPGITDYVDERTARLVPPAQPAALAAAIAALLGDDDARTRLAAAGRDAERTRCAAFRDGLFAAIEAASRGAAGGSGAGPG
jgi:glycosyltransferase involved in cell wall biosynthesis